MREVDTLSEPDPRLPAQQYLIWSEEHYAWWAAGKSGYTRSILKAGRYSRAEAQEIVAEANRYVDYIGGEPFHEITILDPTKR